MTIHLFLMMKRIQQRFSSMTASLLASKLTVKPVAKRPAVIPAHELPTDAGEYKLFVSLSEVNYYYE